MYVYKYNSWHGSVTVFVCMPQFNFILMAKINEIKEKKNK